MKKQMIFSVMSLVALISMSEAAFAEDAPAGAQQKIEQRQQNQEKRIQDGVKSGQITPVEAQKLEAKEAKIKQVEATALADGKLDKKEARHLNRMENRTSREIHRKRHNSVHQ